MSTRRPLHDAVQLVHRRRLDRRWLVPALLLAVALGLALAIHTPAGPAKTKPIRPTRPSAESVRSVRLMADPTPAPIPHPSTAPDPTPTKPSKPSGKPGRPTPQPIPTPGAPETKPPPNPTPDPTPDPAPAPAPTPPPDDGPSADHCGVLDLSCKVRHAINSWFQDLVDRITKPVMELVGNTVLSTPNVANQDRVKRLWTSADVAANSLMVLFALAGALLVMSHETLQTRYAAKEIAPRMVGAMVLANASLWLIGKAIEVANALSQAVMGQSVSAVGLIKTLIGIIVADIATDGIFTILLGLVAATMAVALLVTWFIRLAGVVLLAAGAPLALICHALPATDNLARLWWRAMMACLGIQVAQALVLIAGVKVFFSGNGLNLTEGASSSAGQAALVDLLVCVALFFILLKIPFWARQWVFGYRHSPVYRILRSALIYRGLRAVGVLGGPGGAALAGLGGLGQAASRVRGIGRGPGGGAAGGTAGRPGPRRPTGGGGGTAAGRGRSGAPGAARFGRSAEGRSRVGRSGQLELELGLPRKPRATQLTLPIRVPRVKRPAAPTGPGPVGATSSRFGSSPEGRQLRLPLGRLGPARPRQLRLPFGDPPATGTSPSPRPGAGRVKQLSLPLGLPRASARPRQLRLPLELPGPGAGTGRSAGAGEPAPASQSASSGSGSAPARPVGRQLALPISRPPRPMQLSLPFQPPIRRQRGTR